MNKLVLFLCLGLLQASVVKAQGSTVSADNRSHDCVYVGPGKAISVPIPTIDPPDASCNNGRPMVVCEVMTKCAQMPAKRQNVVGVPLNTVCTGEIGFDKIPKCPESAEKCAESRGHDEDFGYNHKFVKADGTTGNSGNGTTGKESGENK